MSGGRQRVGTSALAAPAWEAEAIRAVDQEPWRALVPAGTARIDLPASPLARRRFRSQVTALGSGTTVVLFDAHFGSRWRCRRFARAAGIEIQREYLAMPFLRSQGYYVQDSAPAIRYFFLDLLALSRGRPAVLIVAAVVVAVIRALSLWSLVGAFVPMRITLGVRL